MSVSRQRAVPPEDFTTEELLELPAAVRATMTGLRMIADDHGRGQAIPRLIWASLWAMSHEVSEDDVMVHLLQLDELGWLRLYTVGDRTLYAIAVWPKVDRAHPSRYPAPPPEALANESRTVRDPFVAWGEGRGEEAGAGPVGDSGGTSPDPLLGPSPFCPKHPTGTYKDCGGCGTARMQHRLWVAAQRRASEGEDT